jgi:L-methionine (R)-S-oxide reductase
LHTPLISHDAAKPELYRDLAVSLDAMLEGEPDPVANLANAAALLGQFLTGINWCGFYLVRGADLVLGPFQGKPACVRIAFGRGVCGTSAERRETLVVPDVLAFPGHIACDEASRSEIVVPIVAEGTLRGVLDVDAPATGRFDEEDRRGLEAFVAALVPRVDWGRV